MPSTGFVTDRRMLEHRCEWDPDHLEVPERLEVILDRLDQPDSPLAQCTRLESRQASREEICTVHAEEYVQRMEESQKMNLAQLEELCGQYEDIFLNPHSYQAALWSAGCALQLTDALIDGRVANGMAAIRPPGHHAQRAEGCGFCIFNNIVICAKHALTRGVDRVLIVDWDVHAGQGTQYLVEDEPRITLLSVHRYERGTFWPNLPESAVTHKYPNTINVPLQGTDFGDAHYIAVMHSLVLPLIAQLKPALILVSCGFDAALGDRDGGMRVTPQGFQHLTGLLAAQNVPLGLLLEGGYFLPVVADAALHTLKALVDQAPPRIQFPLENRLFDSLLELLDRNGRLKSMNLIRRLRGQRQLFVKKYEYEGEREELQPYPTRGLYPKRGELEDQRFIRELEQLHDGAKPLNLTLSLSTAPNQILLPWMLVYNVELDRKPLPLCLADFHGLWKLEHSEMADGISELLAKALAALPAELTADLF